MPIRASVTIVIALLLASQFCLSAGRPDGSAGAPNPNVPGAASPNQTQKYEEGEGLTERFKNLCRSVGGTVGVAVIHVETGRSVNVDGARQLPLYSVFKLPLAISVLKDVEENRLRLDTRIQVTPAEVVPGWQGNTDLWRRSVERSIKDLLELSIVRSDNTSSDKLLQLAGGPEAVTRRLRSLGYANIEIRASVRDYVDNLQKVNTGSAEDLASLLKDLQSGRLLRPPQRNLLLGLMTRAMSGARRIRGNLPPGTQIADKTGTGEAGAATNDVGIIALPQGRGHLAMAVLVSGSKSSAEAQEKLIAELARVAYDAHLSTPAVSR